MNRALEIVELFEYVLSTSEMTGQSLPYAALKSALSDLKQIVQNTKIENPSIITETNQDLSRVKMSSDKINDKRSGLASRIKPVPSEVRGRVRELVDLISEDAHFDEPIETNI